MHLSREQIKLLKQISRKIIVRTNKRNLSDVEYLRSLELITAMVADKEDDYYYQPKITEKGKAVLSEHVVHITEKWIPVIISNLIAIAALIISIIALCLK